MSYIQHVRCPYCGARNSSLAARCQACQRPLYGTRADDDSQLDSALPQYAAAPLVDAAPRTRAVGQLEIGLWGLVTLLVPPLGYLVTLLWRKQERPGADSCVQLSGGYLVLLCLLLVLALFYWYFGRPQFLQFR